MINRNTFINFLPFLIRNNTKHKISYPGYRKKKSIKPIQAFTSGYIFLTCIPPNAGRSSLSKHILKNLTPVFPSELQFRSWIARLTARTTPVLKAVPARRLESVKLTTTYFKCQNHRGQITTTLSDLQLFCVCLSVCVQGRCGAPARTLQSHTGGLVPGGKARVRPQEGLVPSSAGRGLG